MAGQSASDVPFERLRSAFRAVAPPGVSVSDKHTTYLFDEWRHLSAEVAVQGPGPGDDFLVVVLSDYEPPFRDLVLRAWSDSACEVWFVDLDGRRLTRVTKDGVRTIVGETDFIETPTLPGLRLAIADLFSSNLPASPHFAIAARTESR
jgi:hypothetical protein